MIDLEKAIRTINPQHNAPGRLEAELLQAFTAKSNFLPTDDQLVALRSFAGFMASADAQRQLFILKGYAGTGKTTLVSSISRSLKKFGFNVYMMAPTGRAAKVMSQYAKRSAFTIHRTIFRSATDGEGKVSRASIQKNYNQNTLFIVDEASMLSCTGADNLLEHLLTYVFEHDNNKLLFVGDTAQLPPISQPESFALDGAWLKNQFYIGTETATLRQVIRQKEESGILHNATLIRTGIEKESFDIQLNTKSYQDVFRMTGERLEEGLEWAYKQYGVENTLVITRSNMTARIYNQYIRQRILHRENELDSGDLVMVVRNNYHYAQAAGAQGFLANGDFARIKRVMRTEEMHGLRFADVEMELLDFPDQPPFEAKVILDTLFSDQANLPQEQNQKLYQAVQADYADVKVKREQIKAIREDMYLNALQIKFAYAMTCHKSQGGQWDAVFVEQGKLPDDGVGMDFLRWLYTACTRAKERLFLVNFSDNLYEQAEVGEVEDKN